MSRDTDPSPLRPVRVVAAAHHRARRLSALVAASVLALAASGGPEAAELAATLALLVGACYMLALVLRLGWLADYFSRPVLLGYIHGVAIVFVMGQLGKSARPRCGQVLAAERD